MPEILTNTLRNFSPRTQQMSYKLSQTNFFFSILQTLTKQMQLSKAAQNRLSRYNARILAGGTVS